MNSKADDFLQFGSLRILLRLADINPRSASRRSPEGRLPPTFRSRSEMPGALTSIDGPGIHNNFYFQNVGDAAAALSVGFWRAFIFRASSQKAI
jgi:hypothetical protein